VVQIKPARPARIDLTRHAEGLRSSGTVLLSDLMLKFSPAGQPELSITLFSDGRMLLFGTEDPLVARRLYARFVGH
jgi:adenylyltransferase/sulfurtransferase